MSWATGHVAKLQEGMTVEFRPRGQSMKGRVESGQLCTVSPVGETPLKLDDIVLFKVNGNHYLHLIKAIEGKRFLIGNNRGGTNGWITAGTIYGKLVHIE